MLVKYHSDVVRKHAKLKYAKAGDAGLDLCNASGEDIVVAPNSSAKIPAGISIKIPHNCVGLIRCRSSAFTKRGLLVLHNTIDEGFVGPLFTCVLHPGHNNDTVRIRPWEKLGQLLIVPYVCVNIQEVTKLPDSERGESGWGSSGL